VVRSKSQRLREDSQGFTGTFPHLDDPGIPDQTEPPLRRGAGFDSIVTLTLGATSYPISLLRLTSKQRKSFWRAEIECSFGEDMSAEQAQGLSGPVLRLPRDTTPPTEPPPKATMRSVYRFAVHERTAPDNAVDSPGLTLPNRLLRDAALAE
jgi:hypothetical protein